MLRCYAAQVVQLNAAHSVGAASDSTGLMGAALDNLADAGVYGVCLYAEGRTAVALYFRKARVFNIPSKVCCTVRKSRSGAMKTM